MKTLQRLAVGTAGTIAVLSLAGCGGGGSAMSDATPSTPMTPTQPTTSLTIPAGMTASTAPGIQARSASDTIAALLPHPSRQFAPVFARSRTDQFHVKTIASDGANGFRVTYVVGGHERTVHFKAEDYGASTSNPGDFYTRTQDGGEFWLNAFFRSFDDATKNEGSPDFEYLDIYGAGARGYGTNNRGHAVFGTRTAATNLPAGTASYSGTLVGENHPAEYQSLASRGGISGIWRLTADFGDSALRGDVRFITVRAAGETDWKLLPHTTYFRIEDGEIVDGQFAASVTGVDSAVNAPASRTLAGFEGDILGEFYGPEAEEAGGVFRATRASEDRLIVASFGGKQMPTLDPSLPDGTLSHQSVAIERDYQASSVQSTRVAQVTAIESDGASGVYVTYRVDGTDHRVHLSEQRFLNRQDGFGLFDHQADGSFAIRSVTGSFAGASPFNYFDVLGWGKGQYGANGEIESVFRGLVVSGAPTDSADLPSGSASYEGEAHFIAWPDDNAYVSAKSETEGRLRLDADFDASTVSGRIDQIDNPLSAIDEIKVTNGSIQNGELIASLSATQGAESFNGEMSGRFYGPNAEEVGGLIEASYTAPQLTAVVHGWFGAAMQ